MVTTSSAGAAAALLLPLLAAVLHRASAQPTLNLEEEAPLHGPADRFTEGTRVQAIFHEIDLNGDRKLDRHEVQVYFEKRGSQVQDGLWEREDRNGDGVIELHEFARGDADEL